MSRFLIACGAALIITACADDPNAPPVTPEHPNALIVASAGYSRVTAGAWHSCAVSAEGAVACWGLNASGQAPIVRFPAAGTFTDISGGGSHTCAVRSDGVVECWGGNAQSQSTAPAGTFTTVSAGGEHSCALRPDGVVQCWGTNLWSGSFVGQAPTVRAATTGSFTQLEVGYWHSCALRSDGVVECWGLNSYLQSPATKAALSGQFVKVSGGEYHSCALRGDGVVECWGHNASQQAPPTRVAATGAFTDISSGGNHSCGVRSDGAVECWGSITPTLRVPATGKFVEVTAGHAHACAVRDDKGVECWGANNSGQASAATPPPTHVLPTADFTAPASVAEGSAIGVTLANAAVPGHPGAATFTYAFDCGDGLGYSAFSASHTRSCATTDDGSRTVKGKVRDQDGDTREYTAAVTIDNAVPTVTVSGPVDPIALVSATATAQIGVTFTDPGSLDPHTVTVDCGNSTSDVDGEPYSCTYTVPGVYTVSAVVTDDDSQGQNTFQYVVVYDPSAGFVTGGGWITYSGNSCPVLCGGQAGHGDFGFVARYQKRSELPSGDARFEFSAGSLLFVSTSYDWLVVAGSRSVFKGVGQINGAGDYGFAITAVDATVDRFRIKIWDRASDLVVFDNQWGEAENGPASTALDKVTGGGSIVIRVK